MNYYRRYVGDYLRDTPRLSMIEHGAYNLLLDYYYAEERPIPLDRDEVYLMVRAMTPADRKAVDKVLSTYFTREEDGYHNARADHEIAVSRTARTNGKGGGRPPKDDPDDETGSGTETQTGCEAESQTGQQTAAGTEDPTGSGHPPTTNHQPPPANLQPPATPLARRKRPRRAEAPPGKGSPAWDAYAAAYFDRYHVEPSRNARTNALMAQLVDRLGEDDAPHVAAFYVGNNRASYSVNNHPVNLLVRDCEGLRTAWATGRAKSETEARTIDRTMATGNAFAPLLAEAEERAA